MRCEILNGLESNSEAAHIWACPAGAVASAAHGTDGAVVGEANAVEKRGSHDGGEGGYRDRKRRWW